MVETQTEEKGSRFVRGKRCLAGWSRGIVKFVELSTLAGCLTIADGRRFQATRLRTARSFRLAITMIPGIKGGEERERRLLPLTSICKGGEKGRRRVVERQEPRLFNIFVSVCLSVVYTTPKNHHRLMIWDQKRATRNKKKEREKKNKKDSEAKNSNIAGRIFRRRRFSSIPEFRIRHFKKYLTKSKYLPEN